MSECYDSHGFTNSASVHWPDKLCVTCSPFHLIDSDTSPFSDRQHLACPNLGVQIMGCVRSACGEDNSIRFGLSAKSTWAAMLMSPSRPIDYLADPKFATHVAALDLLLRIHPICDHLAVYMSIAETRLSNTFYFWVPESLCCLKYSLWWCISHCDLDVLSSQRFQHHNGYQTKQHAWIVKLYTIIEPKSRPGRYTWFETSHSHSPLNYSNNRTCSAQPPSPNASSSLCTFPTLATLPLFSQKTRPYYDTSLPCNSSIRPNRHRLSCCFMNLTTSSVVIACCTPYACLGRIL